MRKSPSVDEEVDIETANEATSRSSPVLKFFVSLWTRVKFLFTTAFAEVCDCSPHLKSDQLSRNSSVKSNTKENLHETNIAETVIAKKPAVCADLSLGNLAKVPVYSECQNFHGLIAESTISLEDVSASLQLETSDLPVEVSIPTQAVPSEAILSEKLEEVIFDANSAINLLPLKSVEPKNVYEVLFNDEYRLESNCESEELLENSPITLFAHIKYRLKNGEICQEEYEQLSNEVLASALPRNLSDSPETRCPFGAKQLFVWQQPPEQIFQTESDFIDGSINYCRPKWNSGAPFEDSEASQLLTDSREFVDKLISESMEHATTDKIIKQTKNATVIPPTAEELKMLEDDSTTEGVVDDLADKFKFLRTDGRSHHSRSPPPMSCTIISVQSSEEFEQPQIVDYTNVPAALSYDGIFDFVSLPSTAIEKGFKLRTKRSSSLKSEHSPLSTPCRKIVRFADALGLDLATVRQVSDMEKPPDIPASAICDLQLDKEKSFGSLGTKHFQLCFPQPSASSNFIHRVLQNYVTLENAHVDSTRGVLTGTVRVKSIGFEKSICVRVTYNNWATFFEIPASYVQDSHDGATDRFSFSAIFPSSVVTGDRILFAIRYQPHTGDVYWDSNYGENYQILCYAKDTDMAGDGSWMHYY